MTAEFGEACLVGDAFVRKIGDEFRMWYIFGPPWKRGGNGTAERFYRIASARSRDMIKWERNSNYLIEPTIENECQALPTVLQTKDGFHMYFCFRSAFDFRTDVKHSYRLGYAYSQDGEVWVRDDASGGMTLIDTGWDSQMMCYPNLFDVDGQIYLLYNGNEFGRYGFGLAKLISSSR